MFCFFPANLMSSTYTDKNNPLWQCTNKHSQLETLSQPYFKMIFSICLSHSSHAKGWPHRFRSRGTTGSSILDHDFGHLCRGRRIQMSGHSDFWFLYNLWASSIFTWPEADTASAAWPAHPGSLDMISMTFAAVICDAGDPWSSFGEYCIRAWIVFYNITSEYNSTFYLFGALSPIQHSLNDIRPSMRQNEHLRLSSLLHRSLLSYFWLSSGYTLESFPSLPIPCPLLPLLHKISRLGA